MSGNRAHRGKHAELERWVADNQPTTVGPDEWSAILAELDPVSPSYLRRLLRELSEETGIGLHPTVEGVRQHDFPSLQRSLTALAELYEGAPPAQQRELRRLVIEAKDHARLSFKTTARNPGKRATKEEMILWMLTWLENPPLFPSWVKVRVALRDRPGKP